MRDEPDEPGDRGLVREVFARTRSAPAPDLGRRVGVRLAAERRVLCPDYRGRYHIVD